MSNDTQVAGGSGPFVETLVQPGAHAAARQVMHVGDLDAALLAVLEQLANPLNQDPNSRVRVVIEAINGSLTISTITTVGTVNTVTSVTTVSTVTLVSTVSTVTTLANQQKMGNFAADNLVLDSMMNTFLNQVRGRVQ